MTVAAFGTIAAANAVEPWDDIAGARQVADPVPFSDSGNTADATMEAGEPPSSCALGDSNSVWYTYSPTVDRALLVTSDGSSYATAISIYDGGWDNEIACGSSEWSGDARYHEGFADPWVVLEGEADTTYYIRVTQETWWLDDGESGGGNLVFTVQPFTCAGEYATHTGTNGDDLISGTAGPDVIVSRGGNDTIYGRGGNDLICAGWGDDFVKGGPGNDAIWGWVGIDTLVGGSGDDRIYGQDSDDQRLAGGPGNDLIRGSFGADKIFGHKGDDTLHGGSEDDIVNGNPGNDTLNGQSGDDRLKGGDGDDTILGGSGDDDLRGHAGYDILRGGKGRDTCTTGEDVIC